MLDRIIAFSLSHRSIVAVVALALALWGTFVTLRLPIDVLPDFTRPTVTVMCEAHGMIPEDVERLVTRHVERAVYGAGGVQRVRSTSAMGLATVAVEFDWDVDPYRCRQLVQERLQMLGSALPEGVVAKMAPLSSIMGQVQLIGLRSRDGSVDTTELRTVADQWIKPRLLSVPGVAQVVASGGAPRQLQVSLDVHKLLALDVGVDEVARAIEAANLPASGGFVTAGAQGLAIQVSGLLATARDLEQAVVRRDPVRPLRVGDLGAVRFEPAAIRMGDAGVNGAGGVLLVITKQPGADTMELARHVEAELAQIVAGLPGKVEMLPGLYRQADFIQRAVENVEDAVRDGAILVVLVLALFLLNVRTTLITLTALPLSVAVTALCFGLMGVSINTMTLGGLAVAIGALVDDAIVDV
ncbi:MAG: efflux RND transporter permease subunit, partial [Planctomycetes bacterium]|nr:efflux RND transporter permease subunit [Planctomycetota bacterium]